MELLQLPLIVALISLGVAGFVINVIALKQKSLEKLLPIIGAVAALVAVVLIVVRGILVGTIPLSNGLEFAMWILFAMLAIYVFCGVKYNLFNLGLIVFPMVAGLAIWMEGLSVDIAALAPALQSNWLKFHVFTAVVAYGSFVISFAISVMYLLSSRNPNLAEKFPSLERMDELSYRFVLIGLPVQTIMIITGAVWAEYAWGSYWSWDWKENWALITWLIYAAFLHMRLKGWKNRKAAILNLIGFAALVFTFFGVSYLFPGLHSYLQ